jgi:kynurenine formamidase
MWDYRPMWPEVPLYLAEHFATIEKDGWEGTRITFTAPLTGVYMVTASHRIAGGFTIDQVDPARFFPEAVVLDVSPKGPREVVTRKELEALGVSIRRGDAALVSTGWDREQGEPDYITSCPYFERDAVQWLMDQGVDILGGDWPVFENWDEPQGVYEPIDEVGAMILAPLSNLTKIAKTWVKLVAIPLKMEGLCASPCRPFAIEE